MKLWIIAAGSVLLVGLFCLGLYFHLTITGARLFDRITGGSEPTRQALVQLMKVYDLPYLLVAWAQKDQLPEYNLVIDPADLNFLNTNLPQSGLLTEAYKQFVPAEFMFEGKSYPVKVRYRGDKPNHWKFKKKSWRIVFGGETPVKGIARLNLILPEDRDFYSEAVGLFVAKRLGLFWLRNDFVKLKVNGKSMGVYFAVEQWSQEALVNNGFNPDTNLYGEASGEEFAENLYASSKFFKKYVSYSRLPEDNKEDLDKLLIYLTMDDKEAFKGLPEVLDINKFLTWQAHSQVLFNYNPGMTHNANLVMNRDTGKLEFLPWDVAMRNPDGYSIHETGLYNPVAQKVLANPAWLCQRDKILLDYSSNSQNLIETVAYLDSLYQQTRWAIYQDGQKLFLNLDLDIRYRMLRSWLIKGHEKIKQATLESVQQCQESELSTYQRSD